MGWVDVEPTQAQSKGKWVDIPSSEPMDDINRSQDLLKHLKRIPSVYQEEVASGLKSMREGNIIEKGLGALQYLTSPINAPLKALIEEPIQSLGETVGLPRPIARTLGVAGSVGIGFVPTKAASLAGKIAQMSGIGADYNAPLRMGKPSDAMWKEFEDSLISTKTTPANPIKYRDQGRPFSDIVSDAMAGRKSAEESANVFGNAMSLRGVQTEKLYDATDTFNEAITKLNIPKTRNVTPDEILEVWRDVSNKNNELQDYIKGLSDREKVSLAKMAMKDEIPKGFGFKYKERPFNEFVLRPEEENAIPTSSTPVNEYFMTLGKQKAPVKPLIVERAGLPPLREEMPQRMGTPEGVEMGKPSDAMWKELASPIPEEKSIAYGKYADEVATPGQVIPRITGQDIGMRGGNVLSPSIPESGLVNAITRDAAGKMIAKGDTSVIDHLRQGIEEHGQLPVQDAIRNQIQKEIIEAPKGEARQQVRNNIKKLGPDINEVLSGEPAIAETVSPTDKTGTFYHATSADFKDFDILKGKGELWFSASEEGAKARSHKGSKNIIPTEINLTELPKIRFEGRPLMDALDEAHDLSEKGAILISDSGKIDQVVLFDTSKIVKSEMVSPVKETITHNDEPVTKVKTKEIIEEAKQDAIRHGDINLDFMGLQGIYERIFSQPEGHRFAKKKHSLLKEFTKGADELAGVISTRVGNIAPELKYRLRKYTFDEGVNTTRDLEGIQPFFEKFNKLDEQAQFRITELLSNGKIKDAESIFQSKGMLSEFRQAEKVKDSVWKRAKESGIEAGQLENYFPRKVNDYESLTNSLGVEFKGQIDKAIEEIQKKAGRVLTTEEKGTIADSVLRGYSPGTISLSGPTFTKERKITELTPELTQHYLPAHQTLRDYVESLNRKIAANNFFGKDAKIGGNKELARMGLSTDTNLEASIGLTLQRLKEKGIKINPDKEVELKNILKAVFNPTYAGKGTQAIKSFTYATTLTNIGPALTQIQDLALSIEKSGFINTIRGAVKSISGNPEISIKDLGIERIAEEMRSAGSPIDWVLKQGLKWSGFSAIDKVGKESVLNGSLLKYQKMARNNPATLEKIVNPIFGDETGKVISELKSGKVTDDVRFLMFNELSDIQPISKVEVPEKYLTSGKGKIFYALKTYQIKLFDVYRNEIFGEIKRGNVKQGLSKLGRLTAGLVLLGATTDQIKDYVFGRTTDFSDTLIDNFLKIGGFSKYTTWTARKEGVGAAIVKTLAPPIGVLNDATKDLGKIYGEYISSDPKEYKESVKKGFESTKNIPLVGKPYYWWLGEGYEKEIRKQQKRSKITNENP